MALFSCFFFSYPRLLPPPLPPPSSCFPFLARGEEQLGHSPRGDPPISFTPPSHFSASVCFFSAAFLFPQAKNTICSCLFGRYLCIGRRCPFSAAVFSLLLLAFTCGNFFYLCLLVWDLESACIDCCCCFWDPWTRTAWGLLVATIRPGNRVIVKTLFL